MSSTYSVRPLARPPDTEAAIPGSKSITNRALILAALADGRSRLTGVLDSQDTRVMIESLRRLGFRIEGDLQRSELEVTGAAGAVPARGADLYLENSGTSIRFLTALCGLGCGRFRLDGSARMRQRPQGDLMQALSQCGVTVRAEAAEGCPPLVVDARGQFLTALLMVAPYAASDMRLAVRGELRPHYVDLTIRMMDRWGVHVEKGTDPTDSSKPGNQGPATRNQEPGTRNQQPTPPSEFLVRAGQRFRAQEYRIEPDASSASYFFAAAALTGGRVTVPGLGSDSLQGDVRFATEALAEMGCEVTQDAAGLTVRGPADGRLRGISRDMSAISDTSLTLAALAPFADGPTTISNIAHTRLQECDRIAAMCAELTRLGVRVDERPDGCTICPADSIQPATVQTYGDHRVAMSFALVGLRAPGIDIADPDCVGKTFPDYWQRLEALA